LKRITKAHSILNSTDYVSGVQSFRGTLVLKERPVEGVLFSLGEMAIPNKPGRVEWWGQCRLDAETRQSLHAVVVGEASIELEDGRRGQILIADYRRDNGLLRFSGKGELKKTASKES
jgi:hypothetical protein